MTYMRVGVCRCAPCVSYVRVFVCLPVVIEHLSEHARMPVEKIFVEHGIVIGQSFGESAKPSSRYFLQRSFVGLVTDTADIQYDPVLTIHVNCDLGRHASLDRELQTHDKNVHIIK